MLLVLGHAVRIVVSSFGKFDHIQIQMLEVFNESHLYFSSQIQSNWISSRKTFFFAKCSGFVRQQAINCTVA